MHKHNKRFIDVMNKFREIGEISVHDDLSKSEFGVLKGIGDGDKVSKIAERLNMSMPMMSRTLGTLEEKGFVERTTDKTDRRNTIVSVTEAGEKAMIEVDSRVEEFKKAVKNRLGKENFDELFRLTEEFQKAVLEEANERGYLNKRRGKRK